MIPFILKLLIFDFAYSFLVGLILMAIMLPIIAISKQEEPGLIGYIIGIPIGLALCAAQGIIVAAAVVLSLQIDPNRWTIIWYLIGFGFSVPIAFVKGLNDPNQRFLGFGILASNVSYILACIFPEHIPSVLGNFAMKFLI